jgi:hypothetical protein
MAAALRREVFAMQVDHGRMHALGLFSVMLFFARPLFLLNEVVQCGANVGDDFVP